MRQILYISESIVPSDDADMDSILHRSRHNNAIDGITGLLWSDSGRFLQVFEGPRVSVAATFARIVNDTRHRKLVVLQDRLISAPEFGRWAMAVRRVGEPVDVYDAQMRQLLLDTHPALAAAFTRVVSTLSAP